jgi:hypothetical protein
MRSLYNIKLSGWHFGRLSTQVVSDPAVNDGVVRVHLYIHLIVMSSIFSSSSSQLLSNAQVLLVVTRSRSASTSTFTTRPF